LKTHKFRVRPFFKTTLKYLEWKELQQSVEKEKSKQYVLDMVIKKVKHLLSDTPIILNIEEYKGLRHDQRFSISEESYAYIKEFSEKNGLLIAESLEVFLFIYCKNELTHSELEKNGLFNWNIDIGWKGD